MSTTIDQNSTQPYVDFDEFVEFQLRRTQSGIKWNDILTALVGIGAVLTIYLLLFVVFDHWVIAGGFSQTARLVLFSLVTAASVGWLIWKVAIPYVRNINRLYAARAIELAEPSLKSTLLNLVDLRRAGRPVNDEIVTALEKRAAMALAQMDVDHAVDRRQLMRLSYVLLGAVVLACLYALFSPKQISFARAFLPTAQVAPATRTEIIEVAPGDTEVLSRAHLPVHVTLRGEPPKKVMLYYTTEDRRFVDEPVEMRLDDEELQQYSGTITGENGRGILQPITYRIEAADAVTRDYIVTVQQPPSARVEEIRYSYPSYMELDPRTQQGGHIDGWEGTRVTLTAKTNMPVVSAIMQFFNDESATSEIKAEEVRLDIIDRTTLRGDWKLAFRSDGTYPRHYRIQVKTSEGDTDPEPVLYNYKVRPDLPPVIELLSPDADLEVPANAVIPLALRVRDPDFKLRYVNLRIEKNGEELRPSPELFNGREPEFSTTWDWRLKPLNLKPGDVLTYSLEARDNEEPLGNYARAPQPGLSLHIVEPVSEEEAAQDNQRRKEQIKQELEKDDPRANEKIRDPQQKQDEAGEEGEPGEAGNKPGENGQEGEQPGESDRPQPGDMPRQNGEAGDQKPSEPGQNGGQPRPDQPPQEGAQPDRPENSAGEGQQQEFRDDGSQDDEILRELLKEQQKQQNENNKGGENQQPGERPQPKNAGKEPSRPEKGEPGAPPEGDPGQQNSPENMPPENMPPKDQQGAGGESDSQPQGDSAGNDAGKSSGTPESGMKEGGDQQPGASGGQQKPSSDSQGPAEEKPVSNGEASPADDQPGARKEPATGEEKGPATGGKDPDADAPQAKNELERKDGEQGATRERQGSGDPPEGTQQKPGDPQQKPGEPQQKPAGPKTGESGSENPRDADPANRTKMGEQSGMNPDEAPSRPTDDSGKPAARQDAQQDAGNEEQKGKGRPDGQSSEKPQGGEAGSGKPNDQGTTGGNKEGAGDSTQREGDAENSTKPKGGDSGRERGEGARQTEGDSQAGGDRNADSNDKPGESSGQQGQPGEQGDPQAKPGKAGSGQAGDQPAGDATSNGNQGAPSAPNRDGQGADSVPSPEEAEAANLDYNRQAADLALKRLEDQLERGEVDEELLKKFGWTEEQMKKFAERMRQQLNTTHEPETPEMAARRRQLEESLKSLNLRNPGQMRRGTSERDDALQGVAPRQSRVPAEYREAYEAYTRSLSKKGIASPPVEE